MHILLFTTVNRRRRRCLAVIFSRKDSFTYFAKVCIFDKTLKKGEESSGLIPQQA